MINTIKIEKRTVYGKGLFYPLNHVNELKTLTGTKTLTLAHITALKNLGIEFQLHLQELEDLINKG
ncbi:hypothetical protein LCGC14_1609800 [marine sediment metagenome]|uniref:Uncharacterized protein n=1 Tax=marine sediment metagenome TaxID=412755 RepID=A0A0F9IVC2_9ZZZZ